MFCPREQQWTGHFWESDVQHKHKSRWGESCTLWPQSQHHLHHGLMSTEDENNRRERDTHRGRIQLLLVCLTWIYIDIFIFSLFLMTYNKDTELLRNIKHTFSNTYVSCNRSYTKDQRFKREEGEVPHLSASSRSPVKKSVLYTLWVLALWIKEPLAYR